MKRKQLLILTVVAGILLLTAQNSFAFLLVREGQPRATIVVANDASAQVQEAAQNLQEYIEKSSGAKLPISVTATGNAITVGKSAAVDTSKIDEDGFILQGVDTQNYVISGGGDWGTAFGVYDFLERYLGVRWLMPTDLFTDVPQHHTINVPDARIVQQPAYLSRQLSPVYITGSSPLNKWGKFNRARGRVLFSHNLFKLFPVSEFGKTHPEFYPIIDGKRYIPTDDNDEMGWQPNFSAPGIVDAAAAQIEKYFAEHPGATSYSLGMNDNQNWDQSDDSKARRNGKKNYLGLEDVSDDYFEWANAVVEKVLLNYPDKWFGTLAYNGLAEPPTRVGVNSHIVPFITYDRMRWEDPKLREFGRDLTDRWGKVSSVLGWYDYTYGRSYQLPRVYSHQAQSYLRWGADHQVKYSYAELYPNWGEGPKPWVFTKLYWNPHLNVDDLLNDWYTHFAGEKAAPKLKDYFAIWENFWTVDIYKSKWNTDKGQYLPFYTDPSYLLDVPQSHITRSDADFAAALQLADTPERKARVAKLQEMWEFYKASIITYQGEDLALTVVESEAQALSLLDKAENVMIQARKREELLAAFAEDPLYRDSAGYITGYSETNGKGWGSSLLWHVLPWVEKSSPVKSRLQKLASNPRNIAGQLASQVLQVADGKFALVSTNPSFDDGLKSWYAYDAFNKGTWTISKNQSNSGTQSLLVKGLPHGGPVQNIDYQPGTYFAKASCYVPQGSKMGTATLTLETLDSKGEVLLGKYTLPSINIRLKAGSWRNAVIPFTLPEAAADRGALRVRIRVNLDHFEPDGEIYVDSVGLYKVIE